MIHRKTILGAVALSAGVCGEALPATSTVEPEARYTDQRLSLRCENQTLQRCLEEVGAAAGIRFLIGEAEADRRKVSVTFADLDVPEALRRLLDGYSFVAYPDNPDNQGRWVTRVLGNPGSADTLRLIAAEPKPAPGEPKSLDEFRPLPGSYAGIDPDEARDPEAQQKLFEEAQRRRLSASVERALDALRSPYSRLHEEALDVLEGVDDPRATEALIATAQASGRTSEFRQRAAHHLWQHGASQGFRDRAVIDAFERLAGDADQGVRSFAQRVVRDWNVAMNSGAETGEASTETTMTELDGGAIP